MRRRENSRRALESRASVKVENGLSSALPPRKSWIPALNKFHPSGQHLPCKRPQSHLISTSQHGGIRPRGKTIEDKGQLKTMARTQLSVGRCPIELVYKDASSSSSNPAGEG